MFSKKAIRVIAIILAALMVLGVLGAAVNVFAASAEWKSIADVATGEDHSKIPIIVGAAGIAVIALCIAVPRMRKKDGDTPEDQDDLFNHDK